MARAKDICRDGILGLDQSLTHTGITVLALDDLKFRVNKTIAPKNKGAKRLFEVEFALRSFLFSMQNDHNIQIRFAAMEGYAYSPFGHTKSGSTFVAGKPSEIGELGGVVKLFLFKHNIRVVSVAPTTLKKWITGEGRGEKNMMLLKAFKKWGIEFSNDHECDSYGLATIAREVWTIGSKDIKSYVKYEQEVLKVVLAKMKEEDEG
jgi:Holliday junction resolvasome RuvABC endonuclease subunit